MLAQSVSRTGQTAQGRPVDVVRRCYIACRVAGRRRDIVELIEA